MIVHKFGGATTRTARGLETLVDVVRAAHLEEVSAARRVTRKQPRPLHGVVLVISAIGHTTRQLIRTAELAESGDLESAREQLEKTVASHRQLLDALRLYERTRDTVVREFELIATELMQLAEGLAITRELSLRVKDQFLSSGERFALALISALLSERGLPIASVDAKNVIVTNDDYTRARPIFSETYQQIERVMRPLLEHSRLVLVQGFVGATRDGVATTLGSESSDLTATIIGRALGAREITIWKTVPGIFTADPEIVPNAKLIRSMSFSESEEIGRRGARVLFQAAAEPLLSADKPGVVRVAAPKTASRRSTVIQDELRLTTKAPKPLSLVIEQNLIAIRLKRKPTNEDETASGPSKRQTAPVAKRQSGERLRRAMSHATHAWSSESETLLLVRKDVRDEVKRSVDQSEFDVFEDGAVSTVSLVTRSASNQDVSVLRKQMLGSLRQFNVLSFFPVEQSLVAAVDQSQAIGALRRLHREFFGA